MKLGNNVIWLQSRIKQGHESLKEHASATFYIKGSRAFIHKLVRHRIASYSQCSQRYIKEITSDYTTPPELAETNPEAEDEFHRAISLAWDAYRKLFNAGIKAEIARYVLSNACATQIICTWNFREIRHIIKLRSSLAALPEFREAARKIRIIMMEQAPNVFSDL